MTRVLLAMRGSRFSRDQERHRERIHNQTRTRSDFHGTVNWSWRGSCWVKNKTHVDIINHQYKNLLNTKLVLFEEMQNCVETTSFVFTNVALFVSYQRGLPWKCRLGYVNRFWNECCHWPVEQSSRTFCRMFILIGQLNKGSILANRNLRLSNVIRDFDR